MNQILNWLTGGDIRSDGNADEVAALILENPFLFDELFEGLGSKNDIIRGRTADALEKVARQRPDLLFPRLPQLVRIAGEDPRPVVKMHLAMIFGHLVACGEKIDESTSALGVLLSDPSVFTRSWAISSLCIVARRYPERGGEITRLVLEYQQDDSIAIRTRVRKALVILGDESEKFPKGWVKSVHLIGL
jgi:HEAT repeat protein